MVCSLKFGGAPTARTIAMVQFKEPPLLIDRQIVMARIARKIGRGHDAIYHGTRHLPSVLRIGKLLPADIGDHAVFFRVPSGCSTNRAKSSNQLYPCARVQLNNCKFSLSDDIARQVQSSHPR